jgi:bacteriocin biosynthesis cyclodehydratase domain-containing protein
MADVFDADAVALVADADQWLRLRPGASVLDGSADRFLLMFPNYTVTFTSPEVAKGLRGIVPLLEHAARRGDVVRRAAATTGLDPEFVDYLVELLLKNNCLYTGWPAPPDANEDVAEFFAYVGEDFGARRVDPRCQSPLIVVASRAAEELRDAIGSSGIEAGYVTVKPDATCAATLSRIREALDGHAMMACWGFAYRLPFCRLLNELAISRNTPILFGTCEGALGRVGPYVVPRASACLECCNSRLLAHAGREELHAYAQYRAAYEDVIPAPWPTHPVFSGAVARFMAIETSLIALNYPPRTIGSFIEFSFFASQTERRPIYRVPRCPACHLSRPERFVWDTRFSAPAVKQG